MTTDMVVDTSLKLTCARAELAEKLAIVGRGLSMRPSVQIFAGVLMQAGAGRLELSATDMELSIRTGSMRMWTARAASWRQGGCSATSFGSCRQTRSRSSIRPRRTHCSSRAALRRTGLRTYAVEDFPRLPEVEGAPTSSLDAEPLLEAIACVGQGGGPRRVSAGADGRLRAAGLGKLAMVATDSYRLSVKESDIAGTCRSWRPSCRRGPSTSCGESRAAVGRSSSRVLDNHVAFGAGGVWLTTRKIDGQFPDHTKLIPESSEFAVDLSLTRSELLDVVRRMAVMAHRSSPLRLRLAEGELTISVQTPDVGEARESLPVAYSGEPLEIGFNAAYLQDGVESVEGDELLLRLINPLRPGLVQGPEEGFRYLIMPIRLPD